MKLRLALGARLRVAEMEVVLTTFDDEVVTLSVDGVEVALRYDDPENKSGSLIVLNAITYVFQGGAKSLEVRTGEPLVRDRPTSAEDARRSNGTGRLRPTSSPSARAANTKEVYFSFRYARVEFEGEALTLELASSDGEIPQTQYSDRLGFLLQNTTANTVVFAITDPFAELTMPLTVELGDSDYDEGLVTIISHTSRQFALQGLGEEDGNFSFRVAPFYFPVEEQDYSCRRCD